MRNFFSRMRTSGVQRRIQGKSRAVYLNLSMHQSHLVLVQSLNHVRLFTTPWTAACQAPPSSTISQSLLKFMPIELVVLSNHLILCHCLLLPSIFPSVRVFSSEWALHIRWPKSWSFSISPSNEYMCPQSLSRVQLFVTPFTIACQAPLSLGFSRPEYWNGLPCPFLRDLSNTGIKCRSPTLQEDSLL